ncbi:ATP-binding protein [Ralstonia solanacearum]|uniref:ATP-binding protein n=1 Tax=Ralstonia solanacearum TaxID=305 RepID=UPI0001D95712|nr:ATP-binding protein [Ralstonia solanacearum]CBJ49803.1 Histidine kinase, sensor protein [Ralstonia solanacearum PSI07]
MLRSLLKLYFVILVAVAVAILVAIKTFGWLFHDTLTQSEREARRGYVFALREYLGHASGEARSAAIQQLNDNALEVFTMVDPATLADLGAEQRRDLADGKLVVVGARKDYYLPLLDGTVLHAHFKDIDHSGIKLVAYVLISIATLLPLLFWNGLLWRDLRALEEAARGFGDGKLSTRAHLRRSSNVHGLARQFNDMAERIQDSIQHQREMMNGISHELKTPIARLEFGIALLQSSAPEAQRKAWLDALHRDVRDLDELVSELLALSRLEQGATHLALMRVTVHEWLDSVVANIADDVADRQLTLAVHADFAPAHHVCDPRLVARALLNLIRNAMRYARHTITVHAEASTYGRLCLTVEDDGPGIPAAERERVFEPFYRLDASRDRHTGGFGLGLAIVRRIALVHGGEVRLDTGDSGGARFVLSLPAMPMPML